MRREDNTYQLEFRDGVAAEHHQTRTISQEKVQTAMLGWAASKPDWKDGFMWNNIGALVGAGGDDSAGEVVELVSDRDAPFDALRPGLIEVDGALGYLGFLLLSLRNRVTRWCSPLPGVTSRCSGAWRSHW
ncbi:hypothetical protein [Streptomyces sp. NPDC087300]|uniref:hypothetical protein n=1 Tax=Streptomyces sp. NPDC087300 TaxID=3365780 RepID=UPI00381B55BC